jgi:hypothetical protein
MYNICKMMLGFNLLILSIRFIGAAPRALALAVQKTKGLLNKDVCEKGDSPLT